MLLLTRFQYSPHTSQPIQSFPIPSSVQELNLATVNVIVRINSNWGENYTCLYRVSVFAPLQSDDLITDIHPSRSVFTDRPPKISAKSRPIIKGFSVGPRLQLLDLP